MGFFKRLLSLGGKKNKKQRVKILHNVQLPDQAQAGVLASSNEEDHEADVRRLLRSSSARFASTHEVQYPIPPLPHPINDVLPMPGSSAPSIASTSLSQRGTYNVTVHQRRRHASTEFPFANPGIEQTGKNKKDRVSLVPQEDSRVLRLRSDPSVASLIELYDEHGKLASDAFSNDPPSPPPESAGRAQCKRSGSTLRQLLGAPNSLSSRNGGDSSVEGDISWAERFLAETASNSSSSSLVLRTPNDPEFNTTPPTVDVSFAATDLSIADPNNPAISSMEVELSVSDISQDVDNIAEKNNPYRSADPSTPQRASQVFGFLTRGKQSKSVEDVERSLPELPSAFSSPSDENAFRHDQSFDSQFLDNSFDFSSLARQSSVRHNDFDITPRRRRPTSAIVDRTTNAVYPERPLSQELRSTFSDDSHDVHHAPQSKFEWNVQTTPLLPLDAPDGRQPREIKVLMTGPTKVILTAATPLSHQEAMLRLPRGPRSLPRRRSSATSKRRRSALVELPNARSGNTDPFISGPYRQKPHTPIRSGSQRSTGSRNSYDGSPDCATTSKGYDHARPMIRAQKENKLGLSVRAEIPSTPMRSSSKSGSHSLLKSVISQSLFNSPSADIPSPASSSNMSPVGQQMMIDVRQQRMKAREVERERSGRRPTMDQRF